MLVEVFCSRPSARQNEGFAITEIGIGKHQIGSDRRAVGTSHLESGTATYKFYVQPATPKDVGRSNGFNLFEAGSKKYV